MSAAHKGRPKAPEAIAKAAESRRGQKMGPMSARHREKIGRALRGKPLSPAHSAAISSGKTGKGRPDMIGNTYGSRKHTPDECEANRQRQRGKVRTEEAKANMRAAWERRKAARST